jgi:hypothetical protein
MPGGSHNRDAPDAEVIIRVDDSLEDSVRVGDSECISVLPFASRPRYFLYD